MNFRVYLPEKDEIVALDCEFTGIGIPRTRGGDGQWNAVATVSIVNGYGDVIYHAYVREPNVDPDLIDYRTRITGIVPGDLDEGKSLCSLFFVLSAIYTLFLGRNYWVVRRKVRDILENKYVIGSSLKHDFEVEFSSFIGTMI